VFSWFYVLEISNDLRKFAESGFREFFGVISTSDFTLNFQDFDDETFLKFPKFLEIHRSSQKFRPRLTRHFRLKVPHAGKTITPINLRFEAYFPKFGVSLCQLR